MKDTSSDTAIKFGAGRYIQGTRIICNAGEEIKRFGTKVLIIAGKTALEQVQDQLFPSLSEAGVEYQIEVYGGNCTYEAADYFARIAETIYADEIIGIGGGRIMDLSKVVGEKIGKGVVNIPTSIATCAAFTGMSIIYDQSGKIIDNLRYEWEMDAVILDMDVIVRCPSRYAKAGVLDAMAKKIEMSNGCPELDCLKVGYDYYSAYRMAEYVYEMVCKLAPQGIKDIENHIVSKEAEYVAFLNVAMTGILSNATRSYNQSALAHMIYYGVRAFFPKESAPYLHGEIVAVGLFVQLIYNSMAAECDTLYDFMKKWKMPLSLNEIGIESTEENLTILEKYLSESRFVDNNCINLLKKAIKML